MRKPIQRNAWLRVASLGLALTLSASAEARPGSGQNFSRPSAAPTESTAPDTQDEHDHEQEQEHAAIDVGAAWSLLAQAWHVSPWLGLLAGCGMLSVIVLGFVVRYPEFGEWLRDLWPSGSAPASYERKPSAPAPAPAPRPKPAAENPIARSIQALRVHDPNFSQAELEDFAGRLYAAAHRSSHDGSALGELAAYISPPVLAGLKSGVPLNAQRQQRIAQVILGSVKLELVQLRPTHSEIVVAFEANLLSALGGSVASKEYVRERWTLTRRLGARTTEHQKSERLGCPSCGAPFTSPDGQRCAHCNQVVSEGRFAWLVVARAVLERQSERLAAAGASSAAPREPARELTGLSELNEPALVARLHAIYERLHRAWNDADVAALREVTTENLSEELREGIQGYQAQGQRNTLTDARILEAKPVQVLREQQFDAVKFRIRASGIEQTVNVQTGMLVAGNAGARREYSEYWTLLRSTQSPSSVPAAKFCPNCGAPLSVGQSGVCQHCGGYVKRAAFDWLLSKIEQLEA